MTNFLKPLAHPMPEVAQFDCATIDKLVHATVCRYHPAPEVACAWYALLGTLTLRHLYPKSQYSFYAGTFEICTSPDPVEEGVWYALCFDAHQPLIPDLEFHCWIACPDPAHRTYAEVIDFSARHLETRAREFGVPWNRDPIPNFIWTDLVGLEQLKVRQLRPIVELTDRISRSLMQDLLFRQTWQALKALLEERALSSSLARER
ncbi:hypothetical protein ACQ4M3_24455 [Leptolyngbya sp. AN03gr2]|uniref:hypothetical protein n=1 Tax=unclassified Leptolyngbya TaxID=2650499 RepID=UPI003D317648